MSFEWDELIERLVTDNNDVNEILEALDRNWNVAEQLHEVNGDSMQEVVFDNMTSDEVVEEVISRDSATVILNYLKYNYSEIFDMEDR